MGGGRPLNHLTNIFWAGTELSPEDIAGNKTDTCLSSRVFVAVQSLSHVWLLWPHGLQHTRLPGPSPSPGVCSNSCPLNQWCHLTISSVTLFPSSPQSFPASQSFPVSQLSASGGHSIGASSSVLPMNIQGSFPSGMTGWIYINLRKRSETQKATYGDSPFIWK